MTRSQAIEGIIHALSRFNGNPFTVPFHEIYSVAKLVAIVHNQEEDKNDCSANGSTVYHYPSNHARKVT